MRTTKCITENKTKVLRFIFAFFFYFYPFSISHYNLIYMEIFFNDFSVMNMESLVKDFSGTTLSRIFKFGTNIRYDKLSCVLKNQPHIAYQSLYYTPGIYAEGYIVFVFPFIRLYVRSFVCSFVLPSVTWNLRQSFALKFLKWCIFQQLLIIKHSYLDHSYP